MPSWLEHLLALTLVAACVAWVGWQGWQGLRGRKSAIGSCCAKGCVPAESTAARPGDKPAERPAGERVVFLPVEALSARARRKSR